MPQVKEMTKRLERKYSVTSNPGLSISNVFLTRTRILLEWAYKRLQNIGVRRRALRKTKSLKDCFNGTNSLVVGNGPSAKSIDWDLVAKHQENGLTVFAINYFLITEFASKCTPQFLVLSDPVMRPNSATTRNQELWVRIRETPKISLVVPVSWYRMMISLEDFHNEVFYFDDSGLEGFSRNTSPLKPRGYIAMTAFKALAFATFLGFERNYIIGIDNTMFQTIKVDSSNRIIQNPNHLSESAAVVTDVTSFYFAGMTDYFYDISLCFHSLETCFKKKSVINLDLDSFVDTFPKRAEFNAGPVPDIER